MSRPILACFPVTQVLPALDAEGVDLLKRLLQYNPKERITAAEAVRHPWLADAALEVPERAAAGMDAAEEDKASPFSDETQIRNVPDGEYNVRPSFACQGHPICNRHMLPAVDSIMWLKCSILFVSMHLCSVTLLKNHARRTHEAASCQR